MCIRDRNAIENALAGRARVSADLARLATERDDLEIESARIEVERERTDASLDAATDACHLYPSDPPTSDLV